MSEFIKLSWKVRRLLNKDSLHFNYRPIGEALQSDDNLITALRNLSIMSDCGGHSQNLLISREESCLSGTEVIVRQFVRRVVEGNEHTKKDLAEIVNKTLKDAGFDEGKREIVSSFFTPFETVDDFLAQSRNAHIFKARGFSSFATFSAAGEERALGGQKGRGRKSLAKVRITLSPRVLVSLLQANPFVMDDSARYDFLGKLNEFSSAAIAFLEKGNNDAASISAVNLTILKNCLFNADVFLASEKAVKSLSLSDYCRGTEFPTRFLSSKELTSMMKIIRTSKNVYDLKNKNERNLKVSYTCFKCPSSASSKVDVDERITSDFQLRHEVNAYVNVNRLFPLDDVDAIKKHMEETHCVGGAKIAHLNNEHSHLILCSLCSRNNVPDQMHLQFSCCLDHMDDHLRNVHHEELVLLYIYNRLREYYKDDSNAIKMLEYYLLTQCVICGNLFGTQVERNTHQINVCLPRMQTLSVHYGEPLSTEIFRSTWSKEARREVEQEHALKQLRRLTDSIVGMSSLKDLTTSNSIGSMMTNDPPRSFRDVIIDETEKFFFSPSSNHPRSSSPTILTDSLFMGESSTSSSRQLNVAPSQELDRRLLKETSSSSSVINYITIDSDEDGYNNDDRINDENEPSSDPHAHLFQGLSARDKTLATPQYLSRYFGESSEEGEPSPSPPPYSRLGAFGEAKRSEEGKGKSCSKGKKKGFAKRSEVISAEDIKPVILYSQRDSQLAQKETRKTACTRLDANPIILDLDNEDSNAISPSIDSESIAIQEADRLYSSTNFEFMGEENEPDDYEEEEVEEGQEEEQDEEEVGRGGGAITRRMERKRAIVRSDSSDGERCERTNERTRGANESPSDSELENTTSLILARYPHRLKSMRAALIEIKKRFEESS